MVHRRFITLLVVALIMGRTLSAQDHYQQTELGKRSIRYLESMPSRQGGSIFVPVRLGLTALAFTCAYCHASTQCADSICRDTTTLDFLWGMDPDSQGPSLWGSIISLWKDTGNAARAYFTQTKPAKFILALKAAYGICHDSNHDKSFWFQDLEKYVLELDPNFKTTLATGPGYLSELAKKMVLANEAGHFGCWRAFFPSDPNSALNKRAQELGMSPFVFSFADHGSDLIKHLDRHSLDIIGPNGEISHFEGVDLVGIMRMNTEQLLAEKALLQEIYENYQADFLAFFGELNQRAVSPINSQIVDVTGQ